MDSKQCKACGHSKPLADFYPHPGMKDGYLNKCIACVKARVALHRQKNSDRIKEYDRQRHAHPDAICRRQKYSRTPAGKEARQKANKRWNALNKFKRAIHSAVARAVRSGAIQRKPCQVCGNKRSEAHHPDYSNPLRVQWLCAKHHKEAHEKIQPLV